ncbi:unnamed protein product [Urochloa humidicola]
MSGMAQGAVDSLLGRLASVLLDEAQLLGGLRGDVEFIRDEMESMNSLLLHLTEAQYRAPHVRTWMKQVVRLARDCEGNVELYVRHVRDPATAEQGAANSCLLRYLRRLLRFLRTAPVRHRVAKRIRELKDHARDVGERRLRYGVTVPDSAALGAVTHEDDDIPSPRVVARDREHLRRRALLDGEPPAEADIVISRGIHLLIKWLSEEPQPPAPAGDGSEPRLRIFAVAWDGRFGNHGKSAAARIARRVYQHPSVASSFSCKAWVKVGEKGHRKILFNILEEVAPKGGQENKSNDEELAKELHGHLKGKRFLIVLENVQWAAWQCRQFIRSALVYADECTRGSAVVLTTRDSRKDIEKCWSPAKILTAVTTQNVFFSRAEKLAENSQYWNENLVWKIIQESYPNIFAMKMFLHLLYVNANRTEDELENYIESIQECKRLKKSIAKQMLMFCYNEFPTKYKSCLLYLTIFPQGHIIRSTSLARRWISEGLIPTYTSDGKASATDEADHVLDVLATRGFVCPLEISAAGDIKSCTVHHEVHGFITRIARDVNFVDANLPTDFACHLSIHNMIGLQASHSDGERNDIVALLPSLAASSQWQMLKVLDLEGCRGLKKHHLKSICKILLLKYLSLRNTDVEELPTQIEELQCLETLDIRQTKVRVLGKKAVVLPLLKHFLAGRMVSTSSNATRSEESFFTVHMPFAIQRMKNMEILSHVQVADSARELAGIVQLLKLRKLGVGLLGENANLNDLFHQIEKLHRCLRSLSIRIDQSSAAGEESHDEGVVNYVSSPPQFIESLNISGITRGLSHMIQELHQLAKLTLSETYLKEDALYILGKLRGLRYLRLQHKSYVERELAFKEAEFQSLNLLLLAGDDIGSIGFVIGAVPKLERIVWSFSTMEALSGLNHLPKLRKVDLNGDCSLDQVREEIEAHPNSPVLKHNPHHQRQEDGTAAAASSSSAASTIGSFAWMFLD